nr:tripartite motif-containing protein 5-like [Procambarus clarkii]
MEEAVTCAVCSQVYQKGPREPLVLPCGHTFCRSCLFNLYDDYGLVCPTCRRDFSHLEVDNLPLCFSLLGLSATYVESREIQCDDTCSKHEDELKYLSQCDDTCSKHGDEQKYWCRECKVALCSLCLYSEHENGHHVHLAKAYIQERKSQLKDHIKLIIDKNVAEKKEEIKNVFYSTSRNIITLCQKSTFVHDFEEDMKLLSSEIEKVCSIDSLFVSEAKVKHIDMNKLNFCYLEMTLQKPKSPENVQL